MPDDPRKSRAVEALGTAIEAHAAARDKVVAVIALRDLRGEDAGDEVAERASLDVKIGNLEDERTEYRAAVVVVSAPTQEEIARVRARIKEIRDLAVADAARQAGQDLIREVLSAAVDLKNQNSKA